MMDNRRQSAGGRGGGIPATGNQSYGGGAGNLASLDWVVGLRVRVSTVIDDTYEGTIFSYDPLTNTLALIQTPPNPPPTPTTLQDGPQDFRILKISFLKDVTVLSQPKNRPSPNQPFSHAEPKIGPVNLAALMAREREASKAEMAKSATRGVDVTKDAQDIFDALSRTMPCRWHDKQIIVLDHVVIAEPYTLDSCRSKDLHALNRVKKVLEGERKKLDSQRRVATPVSAERKGG
ncbi:hypothetical protein RUND412_011393 [Rhizina undulata]